MRSITALLVCLLASGCLFDHMDRDRANHPRNAMGTGAHAIYPGESGPTLGSAAPGSSGAQAQVPQGAGSDSDLTLLGGYEGEGSGETKSRQVPIIGPITALFGYPFWVFGKSVQEKADEAAREDRPQGPATAPEPGPDGAERERLRQENARIEREIRDRSRRGGAPGRPVAVPRGGVANELSRLEARVARRAPSPPGLAPDAQSLLGSPRESLDRNGDGRADLWVYYDGDRRVQDVLDDDHDGRADRVLHYDRNRKLARTEEDLDGDGRLETVSIYREGALVRKRADSNGDRLSDSWSFYQGGELVRHEVDRDGDGFRDLTLVYQAGELVREEEDRDADGRPDLVSIYRGGELAERLEDTDGDGAPDVTSFYENGKLVRRELGSGAAADGRTGASGS